MNKSWLRAWTMTMTMTVAVAIDMVVVITLMAVAVICDCDLVCLSKIRGTTSVYTVIVTDLLHLVL